MSKEDPYELELLKTTPSSALGSVRYKLKDADEDETDYKRLLEVFKKYNIRYFLLQWRKRLNGHLQQGQQIHAEGWL